MARYNIYIYVRYRKGLDFLYGIYPMTTGSAKWTKKRMFDSVLRYIREFRPDLHIVRIGLSKFCPKVEDAKTASDLLSPMRLYRVEPTRYRYLKTVLPK